MANKKFNTNFVLFFDNKWNRRNDYAKKIKIEEKKEIRKRQIKEEKDYEYLLSCNFLIG